jgi:hypothetical protein
LQKDFLSSEGDALGEIEVEGVTYRIYPTGVNAREVVRCRDGRTVGQLRGSPSSMWRLEAIGIDDELLRTIVSAAIEEGWLFDLPTD